MSANARWLPRGTRLAGVLAGCLLACGGESEPAAGGAPAAAPAAPAPAARAPPAAPIGAPVALEDLYVWDPRAGPAPDLAEDSRDCQAQITGQGLASVAQHIGCMEEKGWRTHPPGP